MFTLLLYHICVYFIPDSNLLGSLDWGIYVNLTLAVCCSVSVFFLGLVFWNKTGISGKITVLSSSRVIGPIAIKPMIMQSHCCLLSILTLPWYLESSVTDRCPEPHNIESLVAQRHNSVETNPLSPCPVCIDTCPVSRQPCLNQTMHQTLFPPHTPQSIEPP